MTELKVNFDRNEGLDLLFLGAHCDDIEIGCGGAILKLINQYKINKVVWVVFASNKVRRKEAIMAAHKFLNTVDNKEIIVLNYKDAFLKQFEFEIKDYFEFLKKKINPHIVFTHFREDRHQDHRLVSDLTWNTFRNHFILEYEIPKYDGDFGQPNFFFRLNENEAKNKVNYILEAYKSQANKHWFDKETFFSIMRLRGLECANSDKYSEAFYCRKAII